MNNNLLNIYKSMISTESFELNKNITGALGLSIGISVYDSPLSTLSIINFNVLLFIFIITIISSLATFKFVIL